MNSCKIEVTKYVEATPAHGWGADKSGVAAKGIITVAGNPATLKGETIAEKNTIDLTPMSAATGAANNIDPETVGGTTVQGWMCGPGGTTPMPAKYLPDFCKGTY